MRNFQQLFANFLTLSAGLVPFRASGAEHRYPSFFGIQRKREAPHTGTVAFALAVRILPPFVCQELRTAILTDNRPITFFNAPRSSAGAASAPLKSYLTPRSPDELSISRLVLVVQRTSKDVDQTATIQLDMSFGVAY